MVAVAEEAGMVSVPPVHHVGCVPWTGVPTTPLLAEVEVEVE